MRDFWVAVYSKVIATLVLFACIGFGHAFAADIPLTVRSDLPLWSEVDDGAWPADCSTETTIAKCSIFSTGDWRQTEADCRSADPVDCESWVRLAITGVFHGRFGYRSARIRADLSHARSEISIIATLRDDASARLFAVQIGFLGGSEFVVLSAEKSGSGHPLRHLTVLDIRCNKSVPGVHSRKAKFLTSYRTEYCVVDSRAALKALALEALNRPPLASLDWVADAPEDEP